jgi:hypothetical protein
LVLVQDPELLTKLMRVIADPSTYLREDNKTVADFPSSFLEVLAAKVRRFLSSK